MTSNWLYDRNRTLAIVIILSTLAFAGWLPEEHHNSAIAQIQVATVEPNEATKGRLQNIVKGILAAWDKADVVCLGEDHGSKNDSDLRITLIEHPISRQSLKRCWAEQWLIHNVCRNTCE